MELAGQMVALGRVICAPAVLASIWMMQATHSSMYCVYSNTSVQLLVQRTSERLREDQARQSLWLQ